MHAGVGACRNCRGRWAYFSHGNWCGRDPDSRGFFSRLRQFEARLQPPLRRSRVVPLHVLYMVESSPRYWPAGLLCTGSWGKCIASLALNAPQRQFVVVVVKRVGLVYSWDQGTHPLTRGRSLADGHTAHEYPPLIHAPYPLLLETPWPAAIKLAREPIPFRATSLTTPVRSLSRLRLSPCQVVTDPFAFFFLPSFFCPLLAHSFDLCRTVGVGPVDILFFLVCFLCLCLASPSPFGPKPSTRSLPSDRSQHRPPPLSSPSTCCPRSSSSPVFLRSFKISSCNYIRQPPIPRTVSRRAPLPPSTRLDRPLLSPLGPLHDGPRSASADLIPHFNPTNTSVFVCFWTRGASTQLSLGCRPLLSFWILALPSRLCAFAH